MNAAWSVPSPLTTPPPPTVCFPGDAFDTSTVNFEPLRERRREVRYPTYEEVEVSLLDASRLELSGVLRDVSRSGFRVELVVPVRAGARVKVKITDKAVLFATVRYCRREADTFHVGASIDAMFCPSALLTARLPEGTPARSRNVCPGVAPSNSFGGECRDLARAIIEDQELFTCGSPEPLSSRRPASDRIA